MQDRVSQSDLFYIHYCLNDGSHALNARIRNQAEKAFLDTVQAVSDILGMHIAVKSHAYEKGGLTEIFAIDITDVVCQGMVVGGALLAYFRPTVLRILEHFFTTHTEKGKLELEKLRKSNEKLTLEIARLKQGAPGCGDATEAAHDAGHVEGDASEVTPETGRNFGVLKKRSNYYAFIKKHDALDAVEFSCGGKEWALVRRADFDAYIVEDSVDVDTDDDAEIEIISPVLIDGKYKWKGVYNGQKIQFSMGDTAFKNEVVAGEYSFSSGFLIRSLLEIKSIYNEDNELARQQFSVRKVYSTKGGSERFFKERPSGYRKRQRQRQEAYNRAQMTFPFGDAENEHESDTHS